MHIIRNTVAILVLLAAPATPVWAADADFSGTWKLNPELSDQPAGGGRAAGGQRGGRRGGMGATPAEMTVVQTAEAIAVQTGQREVVYRPGAGPQEMSGRMGGTQQARWEDSKLVVQRAVSTQRGDFKITTTWSLSEDGKTLTQVTTRDLGQGARTTKAVYEKQ